MHIDMKKFERFEVFGEDRIKIYSMINEQVQRWGLVIPDVPYLMVHFGLHDFFTTGETEFWVANEVDAGYCAKLIFVFKGQTCPYHHHKVKHETFYIVRGRTEMNINGDKSIREKGDIVVMNTGTKHSFSGYDGPCLLLEVSMPSIPGDSYFENIEIGNKGIL